MAHSIRWHASHAGADAALVAHVASLLGERPAGAGPVVSTGRLCPRCGSSEHGRPWLTVDGAAHHVSLSRSGAHLVTVVSGEPVGVDVESVAAVASRWDPGVVLAPGEQADSPLDRARVWARKEAVLKRRGTGLATAMPDVRLDAEEWTDLPAPRGFVAALSPTGRAAEAP